jgi:hypothetical protein
MIQQAELDLTPRPPAPASATEVDRLLAHLATTTDWTSAKRLAEALDLTDRKIRQLAEQSDGLIVSAPGMPGYKHFDHCTPAEIAHAADAFRSQARQMLARSIKLRNRAHRTIR